LEKNILEPILTRRSFRQIDPYVSKKIKICKLWGDKSK